MLAKKYIDLDITLPNEECNYYDQISNIWRKTHQIMGVNKISFAVDFPNYNIKTDFYDNDNKCLFGNLFRIWFDEIDSEQDKIENILKANLHNFAKIDCVMENNKTTKNYKAFIMRRIASNVPRHRRSEQKWVDSQIERRSRQKIEQINFPFIRMRSSSGNLFKLVVEKINVDKDINGDPNGYGLSRKTQIISIPDI